MYLTSVTNWEKEGTQEHLCLYIKHTYPPSIWEPKLDRTVFLFLSKVVSSFPLPSKPHKKRLRTLGRHKGREDFLELSYLKKQALEWSDHLSLKLFIRWSYSIQSQVIYFSSQLVKYYQYIKSKQEETHLSTVI